MRFENKVAMVTGASVGIGRACAVRLAKEGAKLVLLDINAEQLEKVKAEVAPFTTDVLTYTCDVSDEAAVNATVADAMRHFGRIDVLINNAAIWRTWKTFMEVTTEEWKKFLDINVMGVVYRRTGEGGREGRRAGQLRVARHSKFVQGRRYGRLHAV